MTLQRLLNTIGIIGVRDKMVNFTGCGGSVYELNDLTIKNYPILYVSPTGTHRVEENYTTYQLTIFYIDRLLEDNSNSVDIHSAAVEVLKNIIRTIENTDGVIGVSDEYSINLFTETEKFKDRCNGAYATVEISVVNDTVCEAEYDDYNGEPGTSKYIQFISPVEFDTVIAHDVPFFFFSWKTSEPSTHYMIYRFIGAEYSIIMEGDTEQTVLFFDGLGNSGNTEFTYEMQISNEAGTESRVVRQLPYYFLNFTNQDNVQLSADTNDYLINWNTNLETVGWKLYRNDRLYSSGQTTNTSIMAQFPVNTSDESVAYRFVAGYPGGGFERTLNWTQAAAVSYYCNATNEQPMIMQPSESSYTVNFETNCEGDITFKIMQCSMCDWVGEYVWKYGTPKQIVVPRPSYRTDDHNEWVAYFPHYNGSQIPSDFSIEVRKFYFDISTEDNQKIDSTETSFTINYQTNYSEVSYTFGEETGTTSGGTLTVTFPENTGASAVAMEIMFQDSDGNVLGTIHWSQNQVNTYFNILTASGQTISCRTTAFTINYQTNMAPPYAYSYTDSEGVTIWMNAWSPSSLTINFIPNDSQSVRVRTVEIGGQTIKWYQDVPYLNFTSYPSEISKEQQLVCFGWECNTGGKVKYELYSGDTQYGEMDYVRSGRTNSMSGDCITFSANTGDERYYQLDIAASFAGSDTYYVVSDSITFKQKGANDSGSTHQYGYDPLRQITGSPQPNQVFYRSSDGQALPYGLMNGRALDMDGNEMWATSNVYQNGYGVVTFPKPIRSTNTVVENKGKLMEVVWPEGVVYLSSFDTWPESGIESITLPSTITAVNGLAFFYNDIRYINLPIGLRRTGALDALQTNTFNGDVDNLEIYYAGTVAQWNAVKKDTDWLYHKRSGQKVICSDGSVDA